ncbi:MAG TPA: Hpt domain-containing protein [Candidatus Woesebacteria bacterium]|nr:Hpt domain-containing protein [Candidatus Woesebacteria bacterium]
MSTDLAQYRELYLKTSRDLIVEMKNQLNILRKQNANMQALDTFHRSAHSLKSQSLVMGYEQIGNVNRQLEALFLLFKDKELRITNEYLTMIEQIIKHIEHAIDDINKSEHEPDLSKDIAELKKHTLITS